jgi:hypothetical protein
MPAVDFAVLVQRMAPPTKDDALVARIAASPRLYPRVSKFNSAAKIRARLLELERALAAPGRVKNRDRLLHESHALKGKLWMELFAQLQVRWSLHHMIRTLSDRPRSNYDTTEEWNSEQNECIADYLLTHAATVRAARAMRAA